MDAGKAIRSLCVCVSAEGGRGCLHCCVFNERGRVHFHVFVFQMCCNRVIKLLYGVSHLCLAVVLRRCLALVMKEVGIMLCDCSRSHYRYSPHTATLMHPTGADGVIF